MTMTTSALARLAACALGLLVLPAGARAQGPRDHIASHHVSPDGRRDGAGTPQRPWDLMTALSGAGGAVQPGDTVWIHGGRYVGSFATSLVADPDRPIVFRAWPGERATIDGTLRADGAYLVFWGFEIFQSQPVVQNTYGLQARTRGGRFINLVIHDSGSMGVSFWSPAEDAELYGCIIYDNGTHENLDHGVYVHNERGHKLIADNVFFDNLAFGIHLYAAINNAPQQDVRIEGNILFNNGSISRRYRAKGNVIVGGDVPMSGMEVVNNLMYYSGREGEDLRMGYGPVHNGDATVRGNLLLGGALPLRQEMWPEAKVEANVTSSEPRAMTFVRPNRYEPGRAFIAVINGARAPRVKVSLAGIVNPGQRYEIRNVQDVFGPAIVSGTFTGDSVSVPMAGVPPPQPIGREAAVPPHTGPAFDVFLVTVPALMPSSTQR